MKGFYVGASHRVDDDERLRTFSSLSSGKRFSCDVLLAMRLKHDKFWRGIEFDLLVVDIMMPGETGLEFLRDIRENNVVPALFLTAMSDAENLIEGLEAGADDYIPKPFEPRELVLRIKRILQHCGPTNPIYRRLYLGRSISTQTREMLSKLESEFILHGRTTITHQLWQTA